MDHRLPAEVIIHRVPGRIAQIASLYLRAASLPQQHPVRMLSLQRKRILHAPDGVALHSAAGKAVALGRKRAEHVDDNGQSLRLFRAFD